MKPRQVGLFATIIAVSIAILLLLSQEGMTHILGDDDPFDNDPSGLEVPLLNEFWTEEPRPVDPYVPDANEANVIAPFDIGFGFESTSPGGTRSLELNEKLEGIDEFNNYKPMGPFCGTGLGPTRMRIEEIDISISKEAMETLPEWTLVKGSKVLRIGDDLFILDRYSGLVSVDVADPSEPSRGSSVGFFGDPLYMVAHGNFMYVIVETYLPAWYDPIELVWETSWGTPSYRIGSRLVVVDISSPSHMKVVKQYGIEGFAGGIVRYEDRLYVVSNCPEWYSLDPDDDDQDTSKVIAFKLGINGVPTPVDEFVLEGRVNLVHVDSDRMLVGDGGYTTSSHKEGRLSLTVVDTDDHQGSMRSTGTIDLDYTVRNAGWMDSRAGHLRLITSERSQVLTFDLSDTGELGPEGELRLPSSRQEWAIFDGYFVYLATDYDGELTVVDLSNSSLPIIVSQLDLDIDLNGLQLFNGQLLAFSGHVGSRQPYIQITVIHLQVDDDGNAFIVDELTIRKDFDVDREADIDLSFYRPQISPNVDDGFLVVPFGWRVRVDGEDIDQQVIARILAWDPINQTFTFAGEFSAMGPSTQVPGMLFVGQWGMELVLRGIRSVDFSDLDDPSPEDGLEYQVNVLDARLIEDACVQIIRPYYRFDDDSYRLLVVPIEDLSEGGPAIEMDLGIEWGKWFWNGPLLHVVGWIWDGSVTKFSVLTVDLTDPFDPMIGDTLTIVPDLLSGHLKNNYGDTEDFGRAIIEDDVTGSNPCLVDDRALVLLSGGRVYVIDVTDPDGPELMSKKAYDYGRPSDVRCNGQTVYVTDTPYTSVWSEDNYETFLHRIDISNPFKPKVFGPLSIPGDPVGLSPSGDILYTVAYWNISGEMFGPTFNAVRLLVLGAIVEWAFDLESDHVVFRDGLLVQFEDSPRWCREGQYVYGKTNDTFSNITIYDIDRVSGPEIASLLVMKGDINRYLVFSDYLLLSEGGFGFVTLDVEDPYEVRVIGLFEEWLDYDMETRVQGNLLVLSNGRAGISILSLD